MADYVAVMDDLEHVIIEGETKVEFVNTAHSLQRMKVELVQRMQHHIEREEPEGFIAKAGEADNHTYFAARPMYAGPNIDPNNIDDMMRGQTKPREAMAIGGQVDQRPLLLAGAKLTTS